MSDWQELDDPSTGKKYYFNAATNTTQWDPPAGFGAAAASAAPSDWQELTDPGSGRTYYFNAATNVTQWDPPAELTAAKAAAGGVGSVEKSGEEPAVTRQSMANRKSMLQRRSTIAKRSTVKPQTVAEKLAARARKFVQMRKAENLKTQPSAFARKRPAGAPPAAAAKPAAAPAAASAASSPWQAVTHPDTGQTYYYNATTGETAWSVPE